MELFNTFADLVDHLTFIPTDILLFISGCLGVLTFKAFRNISS